jgi:alkyl sulfatase BDS1-like metallo-beta-lactamase superfamily hydrolase
MGEWKRGNLRIGKIMTKDKPFKKIIDSLTGEETIIELTPEEIAENERVAAEVAAEAVLAETAKAEAAAKKQAVLAKLGLDAEEVAALLA